MTSVVVGDVMLDRDLDGRAERLSPDAPVPVVDEGREHTRPGGAGLAAWLAAEETSEVTLVAPFGSDDASRTPRDLLGPRVRLVGLPLNGSPPEKTRVRAGGQPLVRIDRAVSDYGRGAVAQPRMRELPARAARRVPMMWDPHPRGTEPVPGARLICPNLGEAPAWCGERDTSPEAVEAGVATAAVFVQRGAASTVSSPDSSRTDSGLVAATQDAGCTVVATGGCFDVLHAGHVATLRAARAPGDRLVVCLNSDASVRRSKGAERPVNSAADRAAVLSALECVDAAVEELPEASVVAGWGGRTVVLPYLAGRSTTGILARRT